MSTVQSDEMAVAPPVSALQEQYAHFFSPNKGTAAEQYPCQATFQIYTAVDYTVPVYFSCDTVEKKPPHA